MKTETAQKQKPARHTFTLEGITYERRSPRIYTHIVIGDDIPCERLYQTAENPHTHSEWCRRTNLQLGWSQSEANAEKMAASHRARGFAQVRVFPVKREAR